MHPVPRLSLIEQTALHLQQGISEGRWKGALPGVLRLASQLDVSKDTVQSALALLETRGHIVSRGRGKRREVVARVSEPSAERRTMRVGILPREDLQKSSALTQAIVLQLMHDLANLGHQPFLAPKSQVALQDSLTRMAKMVETANADAWVISSGSAGVLRWFHKHEIPFIALGGRIGDSPLATSSMVSSFALNETVKELLRLGHRRIVLVCTPDWVRPTPSKLVRDFLAQLHSAGLQAGDFNAPYHEETPEGFQKLLESLFQITPPTAMIVPSMHYAFAVIGFLAARGLSIPKDLSLVTRGPDPAFDWVRPKIAHFQYDEKTLIRRIVRWVEGCARGTPDHKVSQVFATLVPGESISTPPKE